MNILPGLKISEYQYIQYFCNENLAIMRFVYPHITFLYRD